MNHVAIGVYEVKPAKSLSFTQLDSNKDYPSTHTSHGNIFTRDSREGSLTHPHLECLSSLVEHITIVSVPPTGMCTSSTGAHRSSLDTLWSGPRQVCSVSSCDDEFPNHQPPISSELCHCRSSLIICSLLLSAALCSLLLSAALCCSLLSALCSPLSALCSLLSALCSLLSALCLLLSALCSLLSALCSALLCSALMAPLLISSKLMGWPNG